MKYETYIEEFQCDDNRYMIKLTYDVCRAIRVSESKLNPKIIVDKKLKRCNLYKRCGNSFVSWYQQIK
jgi:hypothetical protein